jgi:hypothetical protein
MAQEFEMSMIKELSFFLGLQIKQLRGIIFEIVFCRNQGFELCFVESFYRILTLPQAIWILTLGPHARNPKPPYLSKAYFCFLTG